MSTGYEEDGTEDLQCVGPPDQGEGSGPETFVPTAFLGMFPKVNAAVPTYTAGITDFSMECWFRWAMGNVNITSDVIQILMGMHEPNGDFHRVVAEIQPAVASYSLYLGFDSTPGVAGGDANTGWDVVPGVEYGWMHLAINFERAVNMTYWINGNLIDTVGINANNMAAHRFYPLTCDYGTDTANGLAARTISGSPDNYANWATWTQPRCVQGPVALHNRLLTAAEIGNSYTSQYVQNIAAVTQVLWDWREILGVTSWDNDPQHINNIHRFAAAGLSVGMPVGTAGTVTVPDLSGNGNDLTLPTNTSYGDEPGAANVAGNKCWIGFTNDLFWR